MAGLDPAPVARTRTRLADQWDDTGSGDHLEEFLVDLAVGVVDAARSRGYGIRTPWPWQPVPTWSFPSLALSYRVAN